MPIKRIMASGMLVALTVFGLFILWHQEALHTAAQDQIREHAQVIASSVWTFEKSAPTVYLTLAARSHGYAQVAVRDDEGRPFLSVTGPPLTGVDALLQLAGLIPVHRLEADVVYGGQTIGRIDALWRCRAVYTYLYILLCLSLLSIGGWLLLKLIESKKTLESRVWERTAQLEKENADRRQAQQALIESEAKYRQLVKHAPAGICEFDLQRRRMVGVNDIACLFSGYTEAELLAMDPAQLLAAESLPVLEDLVAQVLSGVAAPRPVEMAVTAKTGKVTWVLVTTKVMQHDGKPRRAMVVIHDLTPIQKAEAEKRDLERKLVQAHRFEALGTLAGGVAHDFNNLLMGIQGNATLLRLDADPQPLVTEKLDHIDAYVQRGVDLTRQLLGLARGGKYEVQPTDVNALLETSARMFGRTHKEIRIHYRLAEGIDTAEVDRGQIEQVLLNLFINAWQAMPHGGDLYLESDAVDIPPVAVRPGLKAGRYVRLSVTDTGVGMSPDIQGRIFDPFFTTKEMGRGTGLGLASSYGIIKNHEGFIDVASEPGQGSRFTIYLPASSRAIVSQKGTDNGMRRGTGRILVVDDEEMILDVGRQMLEKLGYQVQIADSGRAALEIFQQQEGGFDLVLLDLIMPDMGGEETFERLLAMAPGLKVLLSSGYSIDGQAAALIERGGAGFVQKPYKIGELSRKIAEILEST